EVWSHAYHIAVLLREHNQHGHLPGYPVVTCLRAILDEILELKPLLKTELLADVLPREFYSCGVLWAMEWLHNLCDDVPGFREELGTEKGVRRWWNTVSRAIGKLNEAPQNAVSFFMVAKIAQLAVKEASGYLPVPEADAGQPPPWYWSRSF